MGNDASWHVTSRLLVSSSRLKEFKSSLFAVFQAAHAQSVKMKTLMDDINKEREKRFSEPEVRSALRRMQDDNQVMVADDIIFLIWGRRGTRLCDVMDSERSGGLYSRVQTGRLVWIQLLMDLDPLLCVLFINSGDRSSLNLQLGSGRVASDVLLTVWEQMCCCDWTCEFCSAVKLWRTLASSSTNTLCI